MDQTPSSEMPESELVSRLRTGDEAAFVELMRRYKRPVFAIVYRYLNDYDDACDVTQEVFINVFNGIGRFSGGSKLYTWLYRIAANAAINRLRKRKRQREDMTESLEQLQEAGLSAAFEARGNSGPTPVQSLERKELRQLLNDKLQALPERQRLVFVLRETRQLTYDEIAEIIEAPVGTVKSRLHQARRELREMLRPHLAEMGF